MKFCVHLIILLCSVLFENYFTIAERNVKKDTRRPFYIIASMVNTIDELNYYLDEGANGVEADVWFEKNGDVKYVYENRPCLCHRKCALQTDFDEFLVYARDITKPARENYKENFVLLYLDLKTRKLDQNLKYKAGIKFARRIMDVFFEAGRTTSRLRLQLSINFAADQDFVIGFEEEMETSDLWGDVKSKIGWDIGFNDELEIITETWRKVKSVHNIWIGDGTSNCLWFAYTTDRLKKVIDYKNTCRSALSKFCPQKVFLWTIDKKYIQRRAIKLGIDVIFTSRPAQAKRLIENEFNSTIRLANRLDNPWRKYTPPLIDKD